jgi:Tfp pilus assembly protein PilP
VAAARVPSIPSRASVTRAATEENVLRLNAVNLIGVYGSSSDRRALVRLRNGRYVKVEVGDRVDGGRVAAIGDDELRYVKGGRNITLKMPRG